MFCDEIINGANAVSSRSSRSQIHGYTAKQPLFCESTRNLNKRSGTSVKDGQWDREECEARASFARQDHAFHASRHRFQCRQLHWITCSTIFALGKSEILILVILIWGLKLYRAFFFFLRSIDKSWDFESHVSVMCLPWIVLKWQLWQREN